MPTINYEVSDHRVPLHDPSRTPCHVVSYVKLSNTQSGHLGFRRTRTYTTVHIEDELNRPYGGDSLTYCGRTFSVSTYFFPNRWFGDWHTCVVCHERAMRRNWEYQRTVQDRADKQLDLEIF